MYCNHIIKVRFGSTHTHSYSKTLKILRETLSLKPHNWETVLGNFLFTNSEFQITNFNLYLFIFGFYALQWFQLHPNVTKGIALELKQNKSYFVNWEIQNWLLDPVKLWSTLKKRNLKLTCNISSHPLPIIWSPTTFSSGPAQTSFIFVNCFLCVMAWYIGVKDDW